MSLNARTRFEVLKRDGFACQYCGERAPEVVLHVDHIVARANGGRDELDNLITACASCNIGKGVDYVVTPTLCSFCELEGPGLYIPIHDQHPTHAQARVLPHFVCKDCIVVAVRCHAMARAANLGRWPIRPEHARIDVRTLDSIDA
jgi:hypothetical protein